VAIGRVLGGPPHLGSPMLLPDRAIELRLTGEAGTAYSIEASSNLSTWFLISGGIATNGLLTIRDNAASNYPTLFYRGKGTSDSLPPLAIGLQPDTNLSVSTLVSLNGGSAVLYGHDGIRFTLSLPSNSIPDPSIITMTLVTNLTGLPFARGTLGTVVLEPAGLAFWGAASLEIMFPSNIDRREVISFFAKGDGSAFQLTPDRVSTNRVVIPVTRLGTFGSSLATTQELANAARIGTDSGQTVLRARASASNAMSLNAASTADCFPEKQAAADQARAEIDQARAEKEKEVAALLGAERQRAMLGDSDDSSATLVQVALILCQFYSSQIAPRWPQALNNCALGELLTQNTLSLERQRQLLGTDPNDRCTDMSNIPFCLIFKSCLADIRQCCANGMKGPQKVAAVFGLQRQDQLLGLNCLSQAEAQEVIDLCSSNAWSGTISMVETGHRLTSSNLLGAPGYNGVLTEISEFTTRFDGAIESSQEGGTPDLGYFVELRMRGQLVKRDFHKNTYEYTAAVKDCPGGKPGGTAHGIQLDQTEQTGAADTMYSVSFFILPGGGGYENLNALNYDDNNPIPPMGSLSLVSFQSDDSPCTGTFISKDFTRTTPSPLFPASSLPDTSGSMLDPKVVSGSFSMDDPAQDPPRHIEFRWTFTRHGAAL
jgi:hypothetical protein